MGSAFCVVRVHGGAFCVVRVYCSVGVSCVSGTGVGGAFSKVEC